MSKKRLIITSVISILLVAVLMLGSTYSIFSTSEIDENANVYTTGNLDVTYTLSSSNIQITDSSPMTVEEADAVFPYRITVTNNGNIPYMFDVILTNTTAGNAIDPQYIMTKVGYLEPKKLSNCTNNIIKEDVIVPAGESVDIDVRVWLGSNLSNSEVGKSFYAKLSIDGLAVYDNSTDIDNSILSLNYMNTTNGTNYFSGDTYKTYIKEASFVDYIDTSNASLDTTTNEKIIWDMSTAQDNSIIAWFEDNGTTDDSGNKYYNLYIGSDNIIYAESLISFFSGMINLASVSFDNLDTSLTTTMYDMFDYCDILTNLDLSNFNTSNVTSMESMFYNCSSLTNLDLSGFNTSNVTNMSSMFQACISLTSLDLSNFNTNNVTDLSYMFSGCRNLTSLDVSNFNTSNVTLMQRIFYNCYKLTSLDISNFNTSNVTNMERMFDGCNVLTNLDLSNFNTGNVTDMSAMFQSCRNLTSLNLSSFNTSNVTSMERMFYNCSSLTSLDLSGFNTSNVTNMSAMFQSCINLTSLNLSSFNTSNVTSMERMFYDCSGLTSLDLSGFNTSNVTNMVNMFYNCDELITSLAISNASANCSSIADAAATAKDADGNFIAQITLNYTSDTSTLVDSIITNKTSGSNVVKGILVS